MAYVMYRNLEKKFSKLASFDFNKEKMGIPFSYLDGEMPNIIFRRSYPAQLVHARNSRRKLSFRVY